jgi:site-specific DNA-cytosine methylase
VTAAVESLTIERLAAFGADLWWLSPPCQPFTHRGKQLDLEDPRAASFPRLLERIAAVRPPYLALENVPGFEGSAAHRLLLETLEAAGYVHRRERLLCPSELGLPNRRRRFYLVAGRRPLAEPEIVHRPPRPVADFLDPHPEPDLGVDDDLLSRYEGALHVVHPHDPGALTNCFTAAYGRSPVRSGSYLATPEGVRRFSPAEVLRLLGFPASFRLPPELPRRKAWQLAGNSLSLAAVRVVLGVVPPLVGLMAPAG